MTTTTYDLLSVLLAIYSLITGSQSTSGQKNPKGSRDNKVGGRLEIYKNQIHFIKQLELPYFIDNLQNKKIETNI